MFATILGLASYGATEGGGDGTASAVFLIAATVGSTLVSAALVRGALDAVDGRPVTLESMFSGWDKLQAVVAAVLIGLVISLGLVVLVLPGLVATFLLWFTNFFVVDRRSSAFTAMGHSAQFAAAHLGPLLLTALLAAVVLTVGMAVAGVGLLVAYPLAVLIAAQAFRELPPAGVGLPTMTG